LFEVAGQHLEYLHVVDPGLVDDVVNGFGNRLVVLP
jgi:hypothetical protein